jgi:hypothetical protein
MEKPEGGTASIARPVIRLEPCARARSVTLELHPTLGRAVVGEVVRVRGGLPEEPSASVTERLPDLASQAHNAVMALEDASPSLTERDLPGARTAT